MASMGDKLLLPVPYQRVSFTPSSITTKSDEAVVCGNGDEAAAIPMSKEKKKRRNKKDDEIALYRLKSAEALAGMKQVKRMISRFEHVQYINSPVNITPKFKIRKQSFGQEEHPPTETTKAEPYGDEACKTKPEDNKTCENKHQDLTHVWEAVLKPVRQRVIEIEKVLASSGTSRKSSRETVSSVNSHHDCNLKSAGSSTTDYLSEAGRGLDYSHELQSLKTLLLEEQAKLSTVQENLTTANERAEKAEKERIRAVEELKKIIAFQDAYNEELEKNRRLGEDLKNTETHIKRMEQEFIKRLQNVQDELHKEHLKNKSLLDDLRNASIKASQVKDADELKQKLHTYQQSIHEEQVKYSQLEDDLHEARETAKDEMVAIKAHYEKKLQQAEEFLEEEQKMNTEILNDMARVKENVDARIKTMEEECKLKIQAMQVKLDDEQKKNSRMKEKHEVENINGVSECKKCLRNEELNWKESLHVDNDEIQQKIEAFTDEIKSLKHMLDMEQQNKNEWKQQLSVEYEQQLESLKETLASEKALVAKLREKDARSLRYMQEKHDELKLKQQAIDEEQHKNSVLQEKLDHMKETIPAQMNAMDTETQQEVGKLKELFNNMKDENSKLQQDNERTITEMRAMEEKLKKTSEELEESQKESIDLKDKLHTTSELLKSSNHSLIKLKETKVLVDAKYAQEQVQNDQLKDVNVKTNAQLKKIQGDLKDQLLVSQELLAKEETKSTKIQDKLHKLEEKFQEARSVQQEYTEKLENLYQNLKLEKEENAKLQGQLQQQKDAAQKSQSIEDEYKEKMEFLRGVSKEQQKDITLLKDKICQLEDEKQQTLLNQLEYRQKLETLREELKQEQERNTVLQFDKHKAFDQMKTMEQEKNSSLQDKSYSSQNGLIHKLESLQEDLRQAQALQDEYKHKLEYLYKDLQLGQERNKNLEAEKDKAFEQMKQMEENLQKRLDAFKEVYCEEQAKITELQQELSDYRGEADTKIDQLMHENTALKADYENFIVEKERLEIEIQKLTSGSKESIGTSCSSSESVSVDYSDGQEFTDEEYAKNINNNRIQHHLSQTVIMLQHQLEEQASCLKDFGDSTYEYILHQDQKNQLCEAYIHELELIRKVSEEEIGQLVKLVEYFETFAKNQESTGKDDQMVKPKEDTVNFYECSALATTDEGEVWDTMNAMLNILEMNEVHGSKTCTAIDVKELNQHNNKRSSSDADNDIQITYRSLASKDDLPISDVHESDLLQLEQLDHGQIMRRMRELQAQMQHSAEQWKHLENHALLTEPCNCGINQNQAICTLFDIFNQLFDMVLATTDSNMRLGSEVSRLMNITSQMNMDHDIQTELIKLEYEQRFKELDFKMHLAERDNGARVPGQTHLNENVEGAVHERRVKELNSQQNSFEELVQELRVKVKQQRHSLDDAACERKQWKSKLEDLEFHLRGKSNQLEEKQRSLDLATNALTDLKQDFDRERYQNQRLVSKHHSELQGRDAEIRMLTVKMQHLEDNIGQLKNGEKHKCSPRLDDKKNNNTTTSEVTQLRCQLKKAHSRIKEIEADKDSEIKKLNVKLDKAHGLLKRLPKEQGQCLDICMKKLRNICKELDLQKKHSPGRSFEIKKLTELSDSGADVMRQVQTMVRRTQKIEETLLKDTASSVGKGKTF